MTYEPVGWGACALALVLLGGVGYRAGRRRRSALLPPDLVAELAAHKLECLAEPPARVALELALLVGSERVPRDAVRETAADERCPGRPAPTPDRRAARAAPPPRSRG